MTDDDSATRWVPRSIWPGWPEWTWCAAPWRRPRSGRSQGKDVGRGPQFADPDGSPAGGAAVVGPGADVRDPQPLGAATRDLAKTRGWSARVAEGTVFGRWPWWSVSRSPSTRHRPRCARALTVSAESTAWATQLRMVQAQLLAKIAAAVGDGVVTSLKIVGPVAPSWRKGRYHIAGRGPATRTDRTDACWLRAARTANGRSGAS